MENDSSITDYYKKNLESMILLSNTYKFNLSIFLQPLLGVNEKVCLCFIFTFPKNQ